MLPLYCCCISLNVAPKKEPKATRPDWIDINIDFKYKIDEIQKIQLKNSHQWAFTLVACFCIVDKRTDSISMVMRLK